MGLVRATVKQSPADGHRSNRSLIDTGQLYEQVRQRFMSTVGQLTPTELQKRVLATPAWSVHDVLAHVVALATDLNAQHFPDIDDIGGSLWAGRQIAEWRNVQATNILAAWDREAPVFEEGLRLFGYETGSHFVADLHAHHQDVRGTLGLARDDEEITVLVSLDHYLGFADAMLKAAAWGTLDVIAGSEHRRLGIEGRCRAHVIGSAFEILRVFSGRRSKAQIRALPWTGDVEPLLVQLCSRFGSGYAIPPKALNE